MFEKDEHGIKGGFEIDCGKKRFKLKFGSENTEPFNCGLMPGLQVSRSAHTTGVELHYDRRISWSSTLRTVFSVFGRPINGLGT